MALSAYIRAIYEDGFVLIEDEADQSPYDEGRNIFHAILTKRPCAEHGPMTCFELIVGDKVYSIDWTELPDSARPIRFKNMEIKQVNGVLGDPYIKSISFGYQYTENDCNVQRVTEVV